MEFFKAAAFLLAGIIILAMLIPIFGELFFKYCEWIERRFK